MCAARWTEEAEDLVMPARRERVTGYADQHISGDTGRRVREGLLGEAATRDPRRFRCGATLRPLLGYWNR